MSTGSSSKRSRPGSISPPNSKRKYESTTTKKAVANFFAPASQKAPEPIKWRTVNSTLLIANYQPNSNQESTGPHEKKMKIAAFDLDFTLIQPSSSGSIFSKNPSDWKWWHISVPGLLKELVADGYMIAILTNQGSISLKDDPKTIKSDQRSLSNFKAKISLVLSQLDLPVTLLAATARDQYRKPRTQMWHELLEELDADAHGGLDLTACFFVGDAGGRPARGTSRADHACSDRNFAQNVGIAFKTPEEFFLHEAPHPFVSDFEPSDYVNATPANAAPIFVDQKNLLDVVLLCGSPGSGKSTFWRRRLKPLGYERINQDVLKTRDKCIRTASSLLREGKSVAIDNTNADVETRAVWIQLAKGFGVPIRCVYLSAPAKLCQHNDAVRALAGAAFNPENRSLLPHAAFHSFGSRFKAPSEQEGFAEIVSIPFHFEGDSEQRRIWSLHWI